MTRYVSKADLAWTPTPVRGGTVIDKSVVWEGGHAVRSAFFRMPQGMSIARHSHPGWVQVMVLEGEMQIATERDGLVRVTAGGCYFVEPGETHQEMAIRDSLLLVTQAEDRPEFLNRDTASGR
jgi:quercetin dioxygenase-like cupin family protein